MSAELELTNASSVKDIPQQDQWLTWLNMVLSSLKDDNLNQDDLLNHSHRPTICQSFLNNETLELSIRIVNREESQQLNFQYRKKHKPTNILSFPCNQPEHIEPRLLGDLVICAEVVKQEATSQNKPEIEHWAHIFIHGLLHLLGYDHIEESDAQIMEDTEVHILNKLGISNPYYSTEGYHEQ